MPEYATEQEEIIRSNNLQQETAINHKAIQPDLFDKRTKEEKLEEWCQAKKIFSKADIMRYGLDNFYLRADRSIRDLVRQGKVMRIFSASKMAVYRWVGE